MEYLIKMLQRNGTQTPFGKGKRSKEKHEENKKTIWAKSRAEEPTKKKIPYFGYIIPIANIAMHKYTYRKQKKKKYKRN